jgi:hypothetical protein
MYWLKTKFTTNRAMKRKEKGAHSQSKLI